MYNMSPEEYLKIRTIQSCHYDFVMAAVDFNQENLDDLITQYFNEIIGWIIEIFQDRDRATKFIFKYHRKKKIPKSNFNGCQLKLLKTSYHSLVGDFFEEAKNTLAGLKGEAGVIKQINLFRAALNKPRDMGCFMYIQTHLINALAGAQLRCSVDILADIPSARNLLRQLATGEREFI